MSAELRRKVLGLYQEAETEIAAAGPVCVASGRCCRFKEYGHTLLLSNLEADVLLQGAPAYDPASVTADFCPFQKGNLCTAREPRPLGCRVYYCDPGYHERCGQITETYLGRVKVRADSQAVPWPSAPLHLVPPPPEPAHTKEHAPAPVPLAPDAGARA